MEQQHHDALPVHTCFPSTLHHSWAMLSTFVATGPHAGYCSGISGPGGDCLIQGAFVYALEEQEGGGASGPEPKSWVP